MKNGEQMSREVAWLVLYVSEHLGMTNDIEPRSLIQVGTVHSPAQSFVPVIWIPKI